MYGARSEIHQLLRMSHCERSPLRRMPRVGAGRRVAVGERPCHGGIADVPAPSAVPDRLKFPVPVLRGQPDFDSDVRIRARHQRRRHATEGRQGFKDVRRLPGSRHGERTRLHCLGQCDGGVRRMQRGQIGASGRQRRLRNEDENRKFYHGHISDILKHVVEQVLFLRRHSSGRAARRLKATSAQNAAKDKYC